MMYKVVASMMIIAALIGLAIGCRSTKNIRKAMAVQHKDTTAISGPVTDNPKSAPKEDPREDSLRIIRDAMNKLQANHIDFSTFSAKIKVNYEGADGNGNDFTAYIRIKKDSMIWVKITAVLGIDAFQMLITPDSVKILDKLKK